MWYYTCDLQNLFPTNNTPVKQLIKNVCRWMLIKVMEWNIAKAYTYM